MLIVCDLDGVVWRGKQVTDSAGESLGRVLDHGHEIVFLTNNSYLPTRAIRDRLESVIGNGQFGLITSPMAVASLIPAGSTAWVLGERGLVEGLEDAGIQVVTDPAAADYVATGLTREFNYESIVLASTAVRRGARFVAANIDPTYPTERGLMPGAGPLVAAIECAAGVKATVAGKPSLAMSALVREYSERHSEVVLIGDRVDQDHGTAVHLGCRFVLIDGEMDASDRSETDRAGFARLPSLRDALAFVLPDD